MDFLLGTDNNLKEQNPKGRIESIDKVPIKGDDC